MTDLAQIRERLREAQYAARCAQGAGAFGAAEQAMLATFQEHTLEDVMALLEALDTEVTLVVAPPQFPAASSEPVQGIPVLILSTSLSDADNAAVGRFLNAVVGRIAAAEEQARVATAACDIAINRELDAAEARALDHIVTDVGDRATLSLLGQRIRTQDNRITADPIFIVQERQRLYGMNKGISDRYAWVCISDGREVSAAEAKRYSEAYARHGRSPKGHMKSYYVDVWRFVTACFTEAGCEAYLKLNGHNLCEPRIYASSGYRNVEWIFLREFLAKAGA